MVPEPPEKNGVPRECTGDITAEHCTIVRCRRLCGAAYILRAILQLIAYKKDNENVTPNNVKCPLFQRTEVPSGGL
jgi:hypothetical protein